MIKRLRHFFLFFYDGVLRPQKLRLRELRFMEKRHTGGGRELGCTSVQVSQTEALNTRHIGNKTTERLDTFDQLSASLRQHKMVKMCLTKYAADTVVICTFQHSREALPPLKS